MYYIIIMIIHTKTATNNSHIWTDILLMNTVYSHRVPVVSHPGRFTPTVVRSFHTQYFFQIRFFIVQISS